MKKTRIYVNTSVIGGCFDEEFRPWSNGLMDDFKAGRFRLVLSDVVAAEMKEAPEPVRNKFNEILGLDHEFVVSSQEVIELADGYRSREILTPKYYDDCVHIALASVAEVDLLVSWNFRHIVNFNKIRLFNAVNLELGYKPLQIYSPREVTRFEGG